MIDTTSKISRIDALRRVCREKENESWIDAEELARGLGFDCYYMGDEPDDLQERVKSYHVKVWCCTDTWVGLQAIYFDGKLVGASWQPARKSDTTYEWVSIEAARELRTYIMPPFDESRISVLDASEEIEEYTTYVYRGAIVEDEGVVDGQKVTLDRKATHELWQATPPNTFERALFDKLVVIYPEGNSEIIDAKNFSTRIRITDSDEAAAE